MLPPALSALELLASNLWWSWDIEATDLWRSIDPWRWERVRHNPVGLLRDVEAARWAELARDQGFLGRLRRTVLRFQEYLATPGWCAEEAPAVREGGVAYFSMEIGLHESLRSYSGGLGVLAGDHIRSASDLDVPVVGVTLLYRRGYFKQMVDEGVQVAAYPAADWSRLPIREVRDAAGHPLMVPVPIARRTVLAKVWRLDVGRTTVYLLDADHDANGPDDRKLTSELYGGDNTMRIGQEVLLGIGGIRALRAVGLRPAIYHLNEGHCAFLILDLLLEQRARGRSREEAWAWIRQRVVFTTHTPVPAGHDRFHWDLVDAVLGPWRHAQGLEPGVYMDLGRIHPGDVNEPLTMTVLALRFAGKSNAVSKLHGEVSRDMWRPMWPRTPVAEVPIVHVTNGVHPTFWMSHPAQALFDAHLPQAWRERPWDEAVWEAVDAIRAEALWGLRATLRRALVDHVRDANGVDLDPDALTIGFARRFAPYKRGALLLSDPDRLAAFLESTPAQVVYAGKSHPHDRFGKEIIAEVVRFASQRRFRGRIAFLEDYDIATGRFLTAGSDVWLNNPRRPHEASGTSGQKVPLNGGINLSVLDGWWPEAWDGTNGWAIGTDKAFDSDEAHDQADAEALYGILERDVAPLWRTRDPKTGIPEGWIQCMRRSIRTCAPRFNSHRMVRDYVRDLYEPLVKAQ